MALELLTDAESYLDAQARRKINAGIQAAYNGGFVDYNDSTTSATPINLAAETWTTITNDGSGAFSNEVYAPSGVSQLMDTSTGAFDCTELSLGDVVMIRNDFTVTPTINGSRMELRYQLGSGDASYTLSKLLGKLEAGAGIGYRFALGVDEIYMGDLNTKDNPIALQVKCSEAATLVNAGSVITVLRYQN